MPAQHFNYIQPLQQENPVLKFLTNLLPFGGLIDSGISLISGAINNRRTQELQQELWNRDDTALDRTMQAYARNNLNPLMALPNVSAGNTKGFETSALQSNFAQLEAQKQAREMHELNKKIMHNQDQREQETFNKNIDLMNAQIEDSRLNSQIKQAEINKNKYFGGLMGYSDADGMTPFNVNVEDALLMRGVTTTEDWFKNAENRKLDTYDEWLAQADKEFYDSSLKNDPIAKTFREVYKDYGFIPIDKYEAWNGQTIYTVAVFDNGKVYWKEMGEDVIKNMNKLDNRNKYQSRYWNAGAKSRARKHNNK